MIFDYSVLKCLTTSSKKWRWQEEYFFLRLREQTNQRVDMKMKQQGEGSMGQGRLGSVMLGVERNTCSSGDIKKRTTTTSASEGVVHTHAIIITILSSVSLHRVNKGKQRWIWRKEMTSRNNKETKLKSGRRNPSRSLIRPRHGL